MATIIEHEKRRHEILQNALDIFIEEGYENVTFQKIAARCNITRTTLYIYFKNKRDIFSWSIRELLEGVEVQLIDIVQDKTLCAEKALRGMLKKIIDACKENQKLFTVLLSYLIHLQKAGNDTAELIRRRVIRLRHLLSMLIIRGIQNKEFKNINIKEANELVYGIIESAIFRLSLMKSGIEEIYKTIDLAIDGLVL